MDELLFPVEKVKTQDLLGKDFTPVSGINHAIVGKGKIIHFCSEGYGLVTNQSIVDGFTQHFKANGIDYQATGMNFRDSRFQMDFAMMDYPLEMDSKGDVIYPSIRVLNSYNGYQKYQFSIRILREVCTNGLTALVEEKVIDMLHTPQVNEGVAVEKSMELLTEFLSIYDDAVEPFMTLQDFGVKDIPTRIEEVIEATNFPQGLRDLATERAAIEQRDYDVPANDWLVYNSLNYQLNHNASNLVGRKATTIDKQVLQYLLNY
jgi:hypothetical protein